MATNTGWATSLLDEAAAIVEAEWMRLQQDETLSEREIADLLAEMPAARPSPPRVGVTTTARRRPRQPMHNPSRRWPTRRWPPTPVRATQRSPPPGPGWPCRKALSDKGGDGPTDESAAGNDARAARRSEMWRHRSRLQRQNRFAYAPPRVVASRRGACTTSLPLPGSRGNGSPDPFPPATRPSRLASVRGPR
jgi:hypothetical protein